MRKPSLGKVFLLCAFLALALALPLSAQKARLVFMTAGDVNMLALGQNVFSPGFTAKNPKISVMTIHTGPGDAGSQQIFEKLNAEKDAKRKVSDVDVALVHEIFMKWAMEKDLLQPYAKKAATSKYVTSPFAKRALGVNVEDYVMPLFHSQTALAYNPEFVKNPPKTYEELKAWVKANPGKFGYNGIKGGASGVSFVTGWVYAATGKYQKYAVTGPFDKAEVASWEPAFKELKEFNKSVVITGGNVGTLDALNRGEIWMGPVWVDMFFTFMNEGKLDPKTKLLLPEPGMPGQAMYFVIPKTAANPELSRKFIEYVTSPEVQARDIVQKFNWYPGIDGSFIKASIPQATFDKIYGDVTPADLVKKGLSFPLADYKLAIAEAYEKWAQ
ncbi:MAG TPA: extracellular solute-binding protein [Spirochaetales bacterium]|nr:extracellular solute-binding protein [Spirochaetales bacterium]HRY53822.1 extracellular solute-binding protein [Spirochaetia bacterium]HRZ65091.1 extracellular solute-binding protein [Spirochaetia bacterium]